MGFIGVIPQVYRWVCNDLIPALLQRRRALKTNFFQNTVRVKPTGRVILPNNK
nr:MAG TPA: hypothetical protein [Caudoviricetes sp.]